jgi:hypothetical protein
MKVRDYDFFAFTFRIHACPPAIKRRNWRAPRAAGFAVAHMSFVMTVDARPAFLVVMITGDHGRIGPQRAFAMCVKSLALGNKIMVCWIRKYCHVVQFPGHFSGRF